MGFYIRKSVRVGGVRLNLSGSGVGVSTGIKGFRFGISGRGTYVHMGGGGLYYRKHLSWKSPVNSRPTPEKLPHLYERSPTGDARIFFTEDLAQPIDFHSSIASDSEILRHFRLQHEWSIIIAILGLLTLLSSFLSATWTESLGAATFCALALRAFQARRGVLLYCLEDSALERYAAFVDAFGKFFRSQRLWLYERRSMTNDWKRNAGATVLMKRRSAVALPDGDTRVRTNISVPCLVSGTDRIYFLPDLIVVGQGSTLSSYTYAQFSLNIDTETFIEDESPSADTRIIGHAWQYQRRDGGPDLRFNNNRKLPECLYQRIKIELDEKFTRIFSKSSVDDEKIILSAIYDLQNLMRSVSQNAKDGSL